jgi:predicted DNA-binding protein with PD1-like motif
MSVQMYEVKITAIGEVRDADGNLLSSEPYESIQLMTKEEVIALQGDFK